MPPPIVQAVHAERGACTKTRFANISSTCQQEHFDMSRNFRRTVAAAPPAVGTLALGTQAHAAVSAKVGVLTCHVDSGWGFIFGSSRSLRCTYSGSGRVEHYNGSISKFGVDIGYLQSGVIAWGVLAPTTDLGAGALRGNYGGATAGASAGVGADANVLIGGSTQSISLQPISLEGDKGLNVAAGIDDPSVHILPAHALIGEQAQGRMT
jgi:hypothetical protein